MSERRGWRAAAPQRPAGTKSAEATSVLSFCRESHRRRRPHRSRVTEVGVFHRLGAVASRDTRVPHRTPSHGVHLWPGRLRWTATARWTAPEHGRTPAPEPATPFLICIRLCPVRSRRRNPHYGNACSTVGSAVVRRRCGPARSKLLARRVSPIVGHVWRPRPRTPLFHLPTSVLSG